MDRTGSHHVRQIKPDPERQIFYVFIHMVKFVVKELKQNKYLCICHFVKT